jgi:protein gp37
MGTITKIPWCDHTFNPWLGCTKISDGCKNCYAAAFAHRFGYDVFGAEKPRWFFNERYWNQPIRWDRAAKRAGRRRRVFCGSMCDVFETPADKKKLSLLAGRRYVLWQLIESTPHLDWLLLTKRPENMTRLAPASWADGWPENVWALASVENQEMFNSRIHNLFSVPARIRGLSLEPLLGPINLQWPYDCLSNMVFSRGIDWVIIGGETGRHARPCKVCWVRSIIEQCREQNVPCFVKQLGSRSDSFMSIDGTKNENPDRWPFSLRVRQFPYLN